VTVASAKNSSVWRGRAVTMEGGMGHVRTNSTSEGKRKRAKNVVAAVWPIPFIDQTRTERSASGRASHL
jgi:hypothetical protein